MNVDLMVQLLSGAGALSGAIGTWTYTNTRQSIRAEVAKDAAEAYRVFTEGQPWPTASRPTPPAAPKIAHTCDTPMCPCRGEVYAWCQGCDRTPNVRLMGWSDGGLYLCRSCRADGPTPEAVLDLLADVVADEDVARLECDGTRGNHGDPAIVCAMCCDTDDNGPGLHDWGRGAVVTG